MCFVFLKHPFWDSPFCLITDKVDLFDQRPVLKFYQNRVQCTLNGEVYMQDAFTIVLIQPDIVELITSLHSFI